MQPKNQVGGGSQPIRYNNVVEVMIPGQRSGGLTLIDIGVPAINVMIDVVGKNNVRVIPTYEVTALAGTDPDQIVIDPLSQGNPIYKVLPVQSVTRVVEFKAAAVNTDVKMQDYVQTNADPESPNVGWEVGSIVHNVTKDSWGHITGFVDPWHPQITMVENDHLDFEIDDVIEIRAAYTSFSVFNVTQATGFSNGGYDFATPNIVKRGAGAPIPGQAPGDTIMFEFYKYGLNDRRHQFQVVLSPPATEHGSAEDTRVRVFNPSNYALPALIRWRI